MQESSSKRKRDDDAIMHSIRKLSLNTHTLFCCILPTDFPIISFNSAIQKIASHQLLTKIKQENQDFPSKTLSIPIGTVEVDLHLFYFFAQTKKLLDLNVMWLFKNPIYADLNVMWLFKNPIYAKKLSHFTKYIQNFFQFLSNLIWESPNSQFQLLLIMKNSTNYFVTLFASILLLAQNYMFFSIITHQKLETKLYQTLQTLNGVEKVIKMLP
jgi:hypothetical protein